jgi:hypothetical protein
MTIENNKFYNSGNQCGWIDPARFWVKLVAPPSEDKYSGTVQLDYRTGSRSTRSSSRAGIRACFRGLG